jgi:NAD-dependent deacetylase
MGHQILAELESHFEVYVITQNVDDLHERPEVLMCCTCGELLKVRSNATKLYSRLARRFEYGSLLTIIKINLDLIVWFGEEVPALKRRLSLLKLRIILPLNFLQVYPAAGLIDFTHSKLPYYIDPKPIKIPNLKLLQVFPKLLRRNETIKKELLQFI